MEATTPLQADGSKAKSVSYWVVTGLISVSMLITAVAQDLPRAPQVATAITHLGYPAYFPFITGPAKILGAIVLLVPGYLILKEWAYAGFTILFASAFVSHLVSGDGPMALAPLITGVLLAASYVLRPANRRVSS